MDTQPEITFIYIASYLLIFSISVLFIVFLAFKQLLRFINFIYKHVSNVKSRKIGQPDGCAILDIDASSSGAAGISNDGDKSD